MFYPQKVKLTFSLLLMDYMVELCSWKSSWIRTLTLLSIHYIFLKACGKTAKSAQDEETKYYTYLSLILVCQLNKSVLSVIV